ncbi:glycosyltransferase [Methylobacterium sp. J-070]|uniref:glycosyltransferase n=1 Tax=Methylobacterium sp. J-070 TaxID=2836650 RepID=UPI001FBAAD10|nr:glycosyltransferase [Methylobacterium sp. J-070]MCJ2052159.1 glycosyltransferase [Methylobacterium sp. J-070]
MTAEPGRPAPPPCVVCIPARNEAERLPRLLASLAAQAGVSVRAPLRVVVLANSCTDGTVAAVREVEASGILATLALRLIAVELTGAEAHVGTARRMALDAGADWLAADGIPDGILLTTDADARLPANWVAANLQALESADVVGGRLVIDEDDGAADPELAALHARIERYWSGVRRLEDLLDPPPHDPAPRHGDHTGASLAVPAALYRAVGGLPPLPCGEDNALVGLLRAHGARLRHCPDVHVMVSTRHQGRVDGGMASEMARRARVLGGEAYLLPEAGHWQALILRRAALRRVFHLPSPARAAACARLGLGADDLAAVGDCPNDIAFVERADRILDSRSPPARECPLDQALADLDTLARALRDAA